MTGHHLPFELWGLKISIENKHIRDWKKKKKMRKEYQEISKKKHGELFLTLREAH
jgi:hypothetical protein